MWRLAVYPVERQLWVKIRRLGDLAGASALPLVAD